MQSAVTVSHFQQAALRIGNYLVILAVALVSVTIGVGVYRGEPIRTVLQLALVLTVAAVLGLVGPMAAFGLVHLGDRYFELGHPQLQTMMYLMLSVAGHLTIFQPLTRGPWWSTRPALILLAAVCGTQVVATLIAGYGVGLVTPLGWRYAGIIWAYALAWFLITDPVKRYCQS